MEAVLRIGTMTGLMDIFRRHFVVLTNFSIYLAESRPYWPRGGYCPGSTREGHGVDRPGPKGGCGRPSYPDHPLQPLQGFRGPLRCQDTSPRAACWVVPGIAPPVPHPYTRPGPYPVPAAPHHPVDGMLRTVVFRTL